MTKEISAVKEICDNYRNRTRIYKVIKPTVTGRTRIKGISIADLHIPFIREDLVYNIIKKHSGEDFCIFNGDVFDLNLVSSFSKNKEVPLIMEYNAAFELIKFASKHFKDIILIEGNHDIGRFDREIQKLNPTVQFLVKTSPLAYIAKGQKFSESGDDLGRIYLPNVTYAGDVNPRGWWYKIGKTIFCHRLSGYRSGPMRNAVYMADYFIEKGFDFQCIVNGHCFSEDTEILTNNGWRTIDTIKETDEAATFNIDKETIEFQRIQAIHQYNHHEEMVRFYNNNGLDILVTPEHGMIYKVRNETSLWRKDVAKNLVNKNRICIPVAAEEIEKLDFDVSDDILKILAWIVTEGNLSFKNGVLQGIRIYQSFDPKTNFLSRIEDILIRLGFDYSLKERKEMTRPLTPFRFYINVESSRYLYENFLTKGKIFRQSFLSLLSNRQRKLLLEELCMGDGSKCGKDRYVAYYSNKKELANQVEYLAILSGIRTKTGLSKNGIYIISMSLRTNRNTQTYEKIPYKGRTWCLTVPNRTLVAKRNNTPFITQNSHSVGQCAHKEGRLVIDQGALCLPGIYSEDGRGAPARCELGYAVIEMDSKGNVDIERTKPIFLGTYTEREE